MDGEDIVPTGSSSAPTGVDPAAREFKTGAIPAHSGIVSISSEPLGMEPEDRQFKTGAMASPPHVLAAAEPFRPTIAAPAQFAIVPAKLDYWGNNQYGCCVSSEEAFAKACHQPEEIFIPTATVTDWARKHGVLNGALLDDVLDKMLHDGYVIGSQRYNDGPKLAVDYSKEDILQAALATGPVKIAIDSRALPKDAGNRNGWYATGGRFRNTDHCVAICGYGPAAWLFEQLKVPAPQGLGSGYLVFTWSTIGFVDHAWIMGTVVEAWVRQPTTVGVPPLPDPVPPGPPPPPPPPPTPTYVPPFYLSQGPPPHPVGNPEGYPVLQVAQNAAQAIADSSGKPVAIFDSAFTPAGVIKPTPPVQPLFRVTGTVVDGKFEGLVYPIPAK